ncbi:sarcosine oxidase subunit gamma [Ruegeria halocynthiae]|uniref:Sarcosine oxidase subunit gamma n=1 Tax=Ruegeria halocynthiae TaxID=985054 RepID=A0A1H2RVY2_9RHOB|nr:sarcosine oxidase subunit gamma family protein [Ruegeria halocynthiae]SDW23458.1 sarcosine oxidase subunit gamma [Ruegeria halocynthiae]
MGKLIANTPCDGLLPLTVGSVTLSEEDVGAIHSISPLNGKQKALSEALKAAHGMAYPSANRATGKAGDRAIWFGPSHVMLMGPAPDVTLFGNAAIVDQSDAWTVVRVNGAEVEDVLARVVPVDLRLSQFKRGHTARTLLFHMTASITRVGENAFQIMVFRSMAETLVHDLKRAMEGVAARG